MNRNTKNEILCCLPREPRGAILKEIAFDSRASEVETKRVLQFMQQRGEVCGTLVPGAGIRYGIAAKHWERLTQRAAEYFDQRYPAW